MHLNPGGVRYILDRGNLDLGQSEDGGLHRVIVQLPR